MKLRQGELTFTYLMTQNTDPEDVKVAFERELSVIATVASNVANEVDAWNAGLQGMVRVLVEARREKLLADHELVDAFGFPVRKREGAAETFAVPTTRRRILPTPPVSATTLLFPSACRTFLYENSTRHPTYRCLRDLDRLKVLKSTSKSLFRYASTYQAHAEVGPEPQNSCCELRSQAALRVDRATRDFAPEHAEHNAARFEVSRASRAALFAADNSAETSSPLPKYTSSGVLPRSAACGIWLLCAWT